MLSAADKWQLAYMAMHFGAAQLHVSTPVESITMTVADYADYIARQYDEEPLYVFDDRFQKAIPELLSMYSVPSVFDQDLLAVLGAQWGVRVLCLVSCGSKSKGYDRTPRCMPRILDVIDDSCGHVWALLCG